MISVIIPVYNAEKYLKDLMHSLQNQNCSALDIIMIDDGSTDNSLELLHEFEKLDSRIRVYHTAHKGPSAARNIGIDNATGEYIRFLDADDYLPDDSMAVLLNAMVSDINIDLVIGSFNLNYLRPLHKGIKDMEGKRDFTGFINDFTIHPRTYYYGVVWNKLYKKKIIDKFQIHFDEEINWCEDFLFNIEYYRHCNEFVYINKAIYNYVGHNDCITWNVSEYLSESEMNKIDNYRYSKAEELIVERGGNVIQFESSWYYPALIESLEKCMNSISRKNIHEKYLEFKRIFYSDNNRKVVMNLYGGNRDILTEIMAWHMKHNLCLLLFLLLIGKKKIGKHSLLLKKIWKHHRIIETG